MKRINPQRKSNIRARVNRQTRKAYAPQIRRAEQNVTRLERQKAREFEDVAGAADFLRAGLAEAQGNVGDWGLKGRYAAQTRQELGAMQTDRRQMAGAERQAVRQGYRDPLLTAKQGRADLKLAKVTDARDAYRARIKAIEDARASAAEERRTTRQERQDEIKIAFRHANDLFAMGPTKETLKMFSEAGQAAGQPVTKADWLLFQGKVAAGEGIGLNAARRATELLRERLLAQAGVHPGSYVGATIGVPKP